MSLACHASSERQTVNVHRACELAGVSVRTIYYWIAKGKLDYERTGFCPSMGGNVRIYVDTLPRRAA